LSSSSTSFIIFAPERLIRNAIVSDHE
jgi:hypothetical protein